MTSPFKLILNLPPTDNRLFMTTRNRTKVKTQKYRDWSTLVLLTSFRKFKKDNPAFKILEPSYENQLEIKAYIYLKDKRSDMTNYIKAVKDVMTGTIYKDDKWVVLNIQIPAKIDSVYPRMELYFP